MSIHSKIFCTFKYAVLWNTLLQVLLLLSKIEFIIVPVANPDGYHVRKI